MIMKASVVLGAWNYDLERNTDTETTNYNTLTALLNVRHMQIAVEVQEKATQGKLHRGDIFELRLVER